MPQATPQPHPRASTLLLVALAGTLGLLRAQVPCPLPGAVSFWSANGNAQDAVGGHHGSVQGAVSFGPGLSGQAFQFNGSTNSYVSVPDSPAWDFGSADFSIEMWASLASVTAPLALISHNDGGGHVDKWLLFRNYPPNTTNTVTFHMNRAGGPETYLTFPWIASPNTWQHLVMTRAGTTWTFFVDGAGVQTHQYAGPAPDASSPLQLGSMGEPGGPAFTGSMDEVAIYSRALTPAEVSLLFQRRGARCPVYTTFGSGCAGTRGVPVLAVNQLPRIGQPFSLLLTNLPLSQPGLMFLGFSNTLYRGLFALPIPLDPLGMTGCRLLVSDELVYVVPTTTNFGTVVWSLASGGGTLPNNPTILGLEFFNQGLFVDPGANPGNLIVSNGGHGVIVS